MSCFGRIAVTTILSASTAFAQDSVLIVGIVVSAKDSSRLPYSTYSLSPGIGRRFTNGDGEFSQWVPRRGSYRLLVKQLGYAPLDTTVVISGSLQRLRLPLQGVAYKLAAVRTTVQSACSAESRTSELAGVLVQIRENAEREQLLRERYPFEYRLERTRRTQWSGGVSRAVRDTAEFFSNVNDPYRPGEVVRESLGSRRELRIPQLVDVLNETFLLRHCFSYAGLERLEGKPVYRIEFEPDQALSLPDVRGSILLDTATFAIRKAVFALTRGNELVPPVASFEVTTTYRDLFPRVSLFNEIKAEQRFERARPTDIEQREFEVQKLINVRFLSASPSSPVSLEGLVRGGVIEPPVVTESRPAIVRRDFLTGIVVDTSGKPIAGAQILSAEGSELARTDSAGRFSIGDSPAGELRLKVRAMGFLPADFTTTARAGVTRRFSVVLNRAGQLLDPVIVEERLLKRNLSEVGFSDRQRTSTGRAYFLGPEELHVKRGVRTTDYLKALPNIEIRQDLPYARSGWVRLDSAASCLMNVYVDGQRVELVAGDIQHPLQVGLDDVVSPGEVGAIEVYPTGVSTPPQFTGIARGCGTLLIWTKMKLLTN